MASPDIYTVHQATPVGHSARVRCDVDYWSTDEIKEPPPGYQARHRMRDWWTNDYVFYVHSIIARIYRERWQCVCAGQGGEIYSCDCPIHDSRVDVTEPRWLAWYHEHLAAQAKITERLGWT
jgi:hypothetical protein